MNTLDYRRAMEQLSPDPALEEKIRSRLAQPYRPKLRSRRTAGRVLIAAAAIVCTLAAALAVSPELRAAVLTFFRVEQSEQVPGPAGERPEEPEREPLSPWLWLLAIPAVLALAAAGLVLRRRLAARSRARKFGQADSNRAVIEM